MISLDLGYAINWDSPVQTYIQIIDPHTIAGFRLSKGWAADQRVYFYTKFSKPITKSYLVQDSIYQDGDSTVDGKTSARNFPIRYSKKAKSNPYKNRNINC